jgi:hypothetical protein
MAFRTKSAELATNNWKTVTPGRSSYWKDRTVEAASRAIANAIAAIPNWRIGVSSGSAEQLLRAGLNRAGAGKIQRRVEKVGQSRFSEGVNAAEDDYRGRITSVLSTIAGANDPGRGARGDPRNYQRVQAIGDALHRARLAGLGTGS